ncbi:MAG: hypothetical protein SFV24_10315 [Gemmatimonadales bacterium]|nr:hypothetical protein [Gemmatimonadota bacterium]MDX2058184.1 hypothetical protein [Gemmatimonadales bacterium]
MRRLVFGLLWLGAAPVTLAGQTATEGRSVSIAMSLDTAVQRGGARRPIVHFRNLLADERWLQALDNSLPLVISYSLQTWRSRDGWIDELISSTSWQTVVTKEPLQDEYTVTLFVSGRMLRPNRFAVRDSAANYLNLPQRVEVFPARPGRFYYTITAKIQSLTDRDMDQLERLLAGDPELDVPEPGSPVGRGIRRFLLRIAGLPSQVLDARSDQFSVQPNDED